MSKKIHKIKLDKVRNLRYNYRALELLEDNGFDVFNLSSAEGKFQLTPRMAKLILWAGLTHEDKELTLDQTTDLMDLAPLHEIVQVVVEALFSNLASGVENKKD